jgi:hypothetical protein
LKSWHWKEIASKIDARLYVGLEQEELWLDLRDGKDFLYLDNAYFRRGPRSTKFRLIRKHVHLLEQLDRPDDRLKMFGVKCQPWRKGRHVIVIPPSPYFTANFGGQMPILPTDRPLIFKRDKREPLAPLLEDAHCMVTYGSVAGIEALIAGVPVFAGPVCPCLPVSCESIENPVLKDREPWLASLAYATWDLSEIDSLNFKDYRYTCAS